MVRSRSRWSRRLGIEPARCSLLTHEQRARQVTSVRPDTTPSLWTRLLGADTASARRPGSSVGADVVESRAIMMVPTWAAQRRLGRTARTRGPRGKLKAARLAPKARNLSPWSSSSPVQHFEAFPPGRRARRLGRCVEDSYLPRRAPARWLAFSGSRRSAERDERATIFRAARPDRLSATAGVGASRTATPRGGGSATSKKTLRKRSWRR